MLRISSHIIHDHLNGDRPLMSQDLMLDVVKHCETLVSRYDPRVVHQVAVVLFEYDEPQVLGRTEGDRLVLAIDIRTRVATTVFLRNTWQGKPSACQVMIDINGNEID